MHQEAILVINAGSSSLKFALFSARSNLERLLTGRIERIGRPDATLRVVPSADEASSEQSLDIPDHAAVVPFLLDHIARLAVPVVAVGHRIVHGGARFGPPRIVEEAVQQELADLAALSPQHMPAALSVLTSLRRHHAAVPHVACFDTAFHRGLPDVASRLPIPRRYVEQGIRRYGFHGLSYAYLMEELERIAGAEAASGRVVLAHLGNGASMAAVRDGRCVDTTMALTPASGLVMGTRSGDLDPGLLMHLARTEGMTPERFERMINKESGLLGLSETSGDVRDLLGREGSDPRAREALAIFCYQARKWIGALAAALGGLDTLIFSGGIGENAVPLRARICEGLGFLGIALDAEANARGDGLISDAGAPVAVRVLRTDEELYIARAVTQFLCAPQ